MEIYPWGLSPLEAEWWQLGMDLLVPACASQTQSQRAVHSCLPTCDCHTPWEAEVVTVRVAVGNSISHGHMNSQLLQGFGPQPWATPELPVGPENRE